MKRLLAFLSLTPVALGAISLIVPSEKSAAQQAPKGMTQATAADLLFTGHGSTDFRAGTGVGTSWLVDFVKEAQQSQPSGSQCPIDVNVTVIEGPNPIFKDPSRWRPLPRRGGTRSAAS